MDDQKLKTPEEFIQQLNERLQTFPTTAEQWTSENLLDLKYVLRNVHTHVTYLAGEKFLKELGVDVAFEYDKMYDNGFDIEMDGDIHLVAEIKANRKKLRADMK